MKTRKSFYEYVNFIFHNLSLKVSRTSFFMMFSSLVILTQKLLKNC